MSTLFGLWGKDRALRNALAELPVAPHLKAPYFYSPNGLASHWVAVNEPSA